MTLDERINALEDRVQRLVDTINSNNKIAREREAKLIARIDELESKSKNSSVSPADFGDLFSNLGKQR